MTRQLSALCAKVTTRGHVYFNVGNLSWKLLRSRAQWDEYWKVFKKKNIFILNFTSPKRTPNTFNCSIQHNPKTNGQWWFVWFKSGCHGTEHKKSKNPDRNLYWVFLFVTSIDFFFRVSQNSITFFLFSLLVFSSRWRVLFNFSAIFGHFGMVGTRR